jgi:hypothetical protein
MDITQLFSPTATLSFMHPGILSAEMQFGSQEPAEPTAEIQGLSTRETEMWSFRLTMEQFGAQGLANPVTDATNLLCKTMEIWFFTTVTNLSGAQNLMHDP